MNYYKKAFTIVELLVVIVVIGILAAVSIVSYTGVSNKAIVASIESDLGNASKKIKLFYAENSTYPNSISDCPNPNSQNLCLQPTSGNTFSYTSGGSESFYLKTTNANGTNYYINNNSSPNKLTLATNNPLADWIVVPSGDHYGTLFDQVSGQYATITKSGISTIYDNITEKVYTVPANYIGVNYKSSPKKGYEAVIEDSKTNYLTRSSFEVSMTGWTYQTNGYGNAEISNKKSVHGANSLAVNRTISGAEANVYNNLSGLANSTTYYYSAWTWADRPSSACLYTYNATTNLISVCNSGNSKWERIGGTFVSSATGTAQLRLGNNTIDSTGYFDAVQVEQGDYQTSYIPTEAAAASRNACTVTIPTVSSFSEGTLIASINNGIRNNTAIYSFGINSSNSIMHYLNNPGSAQSVFYSTATTYGPTASPVNNNIAAWRWNSTSSRQYVIGSHSNVGTITAPTGTPTTTYVGCFFGGTGGCFNSPIQRLVIYSSYLSDSEVVDISNAIING